MKTCRLCQNSSDLRKSHIFPKSIYRNLKEGNGQLLSLSVDKPLEAKLSNSNPTEMMLCDECEQFLNLNYEGYGTRLLKNPKLFKKTHEGLIIRNFKFNKFYLYLISILWRATESALLVFSNVELGSKLNEYLRYCIHQRSTKLFASLKLEHFVRISMVKLIDPSGDVPPEVMRKLLMYITKELGESAQDPSVFYFVVDGFLIIYYLRIFDDIYKQRTELIAAQLTDTNKVFVPKVDYRTFKFLNQAFEAINEYHKKAC